MEQGEYVRSGTLYEPHCLLAEAELPARKGCERSERRQRAAQWGSVRSVIATLGDQRSLTYAPQSPQLRLDYGGRCAELWDVCKSASRVQSMSCVPCSEILADVMATDCIYPTAEAKRDRRPGTASRSRVGNTAAFAAIRACSFAVYAADVPHT